MADLGIPVDDRGLLDQIFGNGSMVSPAQDVGSVQSSGNVSSEAFEWPQVSSTRGREDTKDMYPYPNGLPGDVDRGYGDADNIPWGVGGERMALPTPPSPGMKRREESYASMVDERRRMGVSL